MKLEELLEQKYQEYNQPAFIANDPIGIPHQFSRLQDIEIMGFWAAMLAWGQRKTIINKCHELIELMDGAPYDFIKNHKEEDRKRFLNFKHRTFQLTDTLYFLEFLQHFYQKNDSLELAFIPDLKAASTEAKPALTHFHTLFFSLPDSPKRTRKHVATPASKSACKRLNMFLRWMVRDDNLGVDFGLWKRLSPKDLICPLDVHVGRVARQVGLLSRKKDDWQAAEELTENLRRFDSSDPVRYDFALFGMGLEQSGRI